MKQALPLLLTSVLLFSACKKNTPATGNGSSGTTMLSGISDNSNKTLASFSYSGKLLSKAVLTDGAFAETHVFSYDTQGNLTGSTITSANPAYSGDVSSVITYNSLGAIGEIQFYKPNNVLDQLVAFVYVNGQLASWTSSNYTGGSLSEKISITYSFTGINNSQQTTYFTAFPGATLTIGSFDSQNNICNAFPVYLYFATNTLQPHPCLPQIPGQNNPTSYTSKLQTGASIPGTITYTYNADNYPSSANMVAFNYNFATAPNVISFTTAQYNYSYIDVQ